MIPTPANSISNPSLPPQRSAFFGPLGLRAGWSIAIFLAFTFLFASLFGFLALAASGLRSEKLAEQRTARRPQTQTETQHHPAPTKAPTLIHATDFTLNDGSIFLALLLSTFALSLIERRSFTVYGINLRSLPDLLPGALTGLVSLSLLVFILRALHLLVFDARLLFGRAAYASGASWLLACLCVGLMEEYLTRGFLQYTLTRSLLNLGRRISPKHARAAAFSLAALIMSLIFGAGHLNNAGENPMGLVMVFLAGILFSYSLWRTGSLWWAIGFHCTWDFAMNFLYGVPDSGTLSFGRLFQTHPVGPNLLSGGIDGPEGSVLVIPTLFLVYLILRFTTRQAPQPPLEPTPRLAVQATSLNLT
jgi:membrane protease YdiL (CAAX protease family)